MVNGTLGIWGVIAGPYKLVENTLHSKWSFPALSIIAWLKCNMWSYGSDESSYMAKDGMKNPRGGS